MASLRCWIVPDATRMTPAISRAIDLLHLPFGGGVGIVRTEGEFEVHEPWAIARYGQHRLARGWWVFESASEAGHVPAEVRLTSGRNPLIVLPASDKANSAARVRIYLPSPETFEVALLISAWPGKARFQDLRLRRLNSAETMGVVWTGITRLLTQRGGIGKILRVARQMLGGSAVGMRASASSDNSMPSDATPRVRDDAARLVAERHGDMAVLMREGDRLDPRAVAIATEAFEHQPHLSIIYSDLADGEAIAPLPAREAVDTRWFDLARPPLFLRDGAAVSSAGADLFLTKLAEKFGPEEVGRIPLPLVRGGNDLRSRLPEAAAPSLARLPLVSIIIPTKFRMDLLATALDALAHRTGYPNLEIVIVDNGSTDARLPQIIETARQIFEVVHIRDAGDFNFSRLVNAGVRASRGEMIVLLNDDVEPKSEGWLHRIVESLLQPDVGAVGVRLLYPNGALQHAGVMMGIGGLCGHLWKGLSEESAACLPYVVYPGERTAVTGACLAARREVFDAVGGFDEVFPVSLNDIDFCLRIRASGKKIIYRGDAVLVHHESMSRGLDSASPATRERAARERQIFLTRWLHEVREDRFSSPAFDPRTESGAAHYSALRVVTA